jgi:hypothetical protein
MPMPSMPLLARGMDPEYRVAPQWAGSLTALATSAFAIGPYLSIGDRGAKPKLILLLVCIMVDQ